LKGTNRNDPITEKFLYTPADVAKINHTVPVSTVDSKEYSAVVFPGGNGATYDFPWDKNINRIAAAIYEQRRSCKSLKSIVLFLRLSIT